MNKISITLNFKPLKWTKNSDLKNIIQAEPEGLRWKYYITLEDRGSALNLIDDSSQHNKELSKLYATLTEAKKMAKEHYKAILNSFIV